MYEIDKKLHPLTHFNVKNLNEPFKKYIHFEVGGGGLRSDGQKRKRGMGLIQYLL